MKEKLLLIMRDHESSSLERIKELLSVIESAGKDEGIALFRFFLNSWKEAGFPEGEEAEDLTISGFTMLEDKVGEELVSSIVKLFFESWYNQEVLLQDLWTLIHEVEDEDNRAALVEVVAQSELLPLPSEYELASNTLKRAFQNEKQREQETGDFLFPELLDPLDIN